MWKFLDYKEHLDWLKIDLNAVKIITVQDCKHAKKLMQIEIYIYSVKATSQAGNISVKDIMATQKSQSEEKIN